MMTFVNDFSIHRSKDILVSRKIDTHVTVIGVLFTQQILTT